MNFVNKSERVCERGRLIFAWRLSVPSVSDGYLPESAKAFERSCRTELAEWARRKFYECGARSCRVLRASFVADEKGRVEIALLFGNEKLLERTFEVGLGEPQNKTKKHNPRNKKRAAAHNKPSTSTTPN